MFATVLHQHFFTDSGKEINTLCSEKLKNQLFIPVRSLTYQSFRPDHMSKDHL